MKRILYTGATLFFAFTILFATSRTVRADGGGGHGVEMEVNGYHVTLSSQNDWVKGENTIVVTLADGMEMPVSNADVEILITPKADEHATGQPQESMPGMDDAPAMSDMSTPVTAEPGTMTRVERTVSPVSLLEAEPGTYTLNTNLESSGELNVHVYFHVNGEMLQADFVVVVAGATSKPIVLWSFAAVNVALITTAGVMKKKKTIKVKGA
jgi:hypothetical protein